MGRAFELKMSFILKFLAEELTLPHPNQGVSMKTGTEAHI
jgi:hypothetical protein